MSFFTNIKNDREVKKKISKLMETMYRQFHTSSKLEIEKWGNEYFKANYDDIEAFEKFFRSIMTCNASPIMLGEFTDEALPIFLDANKRAKYEILRHFLENFRIIKDVVNNDNFTIEDLVSIEEKAKGVSWHIIYSIFDNKYNIKEIMWLLSKVEKGDSIFIPKKLSIEDIKSFLDKDYKLADLWVFDKKTVDEVNKVISKYSRQDSLKLLHSSIDFEVLEFYINKDFTASEIVYSYSIQPDFSIDFLRVLFTYKVKDKKEFFEKYS